MFYWKIQGLMVYWINEDFYLADVVHLFTINLKDIK